MMESKKWYQSKTIWGIVIAFFGFMLTNYLQIPDLNLPENADYAQLQQAVKTIQESQGNLSAIIGQVMGMLGTIVAIIGRVKAESKLG